jgi:hypothetical protein
MTSIKGALFFEIQMEFSCSTEIIRIPIPIIGYKDIIPWQRSSQKKIIRSAKEDQLSLPST